jgi:hypothetical protein
MDIQKGIVGILEIDGQIAGTGLIRIKDTAAIWSRGSAVEIDKKRSRKRAFPRPFFFLVFMRLFHPPQVEFCNLLPY